MDTQKKFNKIDYFLMFAISSKCMLDCEYCLARDYLKTNTPQIIDYDKLLKTINADDKTYCIYFTGGGEPFLVANFLEACQAISQRHYLIISSNLCSDEVEAFSQTVNPERVVLIIASVQIKELKKRGLTEKYISNFQLLKSRGFNLAATVVAYPPLADEMEKYKKEFAAHGINLESLNFIGEYQGKMYPQAYTKEEIKKFGLNIEIHRQKNLICNAGYNTAVTNYDGRVCVCSSIKLNLGNIHSKINWRPNLIRCPEGFCSCPLNFFVPELYERALNDREAKITNVKMAKLIISLKEYGFYCIGHFGSLIKKINHILRGQLK